MATCVLLHVYFPLICCFYLGPEPAGILSDVCFIVLQTGGRTLEKLRRLNQDKPFVVADLGWSIQESLPKVQDPPELICSRAISSKKRSPMEVVKSVKGPKLARNGEPDGGFLSAVRPFRTQGKDCIPSVRESFAIMKEPFSRAKGYFDLDVPNDGDVYDIPGGDGLWTMSCAAEPVLEQLHYELQSLRVDFLERAEQLKGTGM